jgi:hypothetical protein
VTIRDWVVQKVREDTPHSVEVEGDRGLVVKRTGMPTARVYCPETSDTLPFTDDDLRRAIEEMPDVQFVVAIRRRIANDTYAPADQEGVALGNLGALKAALRDFPDVSRHKWPEQEFVQKRLSRNKHVLGWRRRGANTYEVTRKAGNRTITIVTIDHYELTADAVYELLEAHDGFDIDAIVTTNRHCRGFSPSTLTAVSAAGTQILTMDDFVLSLDAPWD